jgi:hypothetical protein
MSGAVAPAEHPTMQLAARCRAEPIVLDDVCPELCSALEQVILHRMRTGRRTGSLNVGGWKSAEDFFTWPDAPVQELRQAIIAEIGVQPIAWAMVNRAGSHHPRHQHRIATLSGVFYVTHGDPIVPTVFETKLGDLEVEPHPGRLVICPGVMWHRVPKYEGETPRITIAFDVRR